MKPKPTLFAAALEVCSAGCAFAQHPACQFDEAGRRVNAEECTKAKIKAAEGVAAEERAREIARFDGNGITNTRPFAAKGPWEIRWWSKGNLSIYIHRINKGGDQDHVSDVVSGSEFGSSFFPKEGQFFLTIAGGSDPWRVIVTPYEAGN